MSNPCQNGATCIDRANSFVCECLVGFVGARCQTLRACLSNPCINGGTCNDTQIGYQCFCPPLFGGLNCQIGTLFALVLRMYLRTQMNRLLAFSDHVCASLPCQNGGTCFNDGFIGGCNCTRGLTGAACEADVNECATESGGCGSWSVCSNLLGSWSCSVVFVNGSLNATTPAAYHYETTGPAPISVLTSTAAGQVLEFQLSAPFSQSLAFAFALGASADDPFRVLCADPMAIGPPLFDETVRNAPRRDSLALGFSSSCVLYSVPLASRFNYSVAPCDRSWLVSIYVCLRMVAMVHYSQRVPIKFRTVRPRSTRVHYHRTEPVIQAQRRTR